MRRTVQTTAVLLALASDPNREWYGMELMRWFDMKAGLVYPILARLEAEGLARSRWEAIDPVAEGRPRRHLYRITAAGLIHAADARRWFNQRIHLP